MRKYISRFPSTFDWRVLKPSLCQVFVLSTMILLASCQKHAEESVQSEKVVRICFTGDVMLSRGVKGIINKKGIEFPFESIYPILRLYDYRFINLECPITKLTYPPDKPFSFRADSDYVGILTGAGITHATLANNHIDDQRIAGATDTYNFLIANGIASIGLKGKEDTICMPAEINLGRRRLAVFGALGIEMKLSNIWFCYDSLFQKNVETYRKNNPSAFIICYLHWGIEYLKFPSPDQQDVAKKLIDVGADMIIGHHPHVIESIRYYKNRPIFFSLGNFIFDQHDPDTKKGIIAGLTFRDSTVETDIIPYDINEDRPAPLPLEEKEGFKQSLLKISDNVLLVDNDYGWRLKENKSGEMIAQKDFAMPLFDK